VGGAGIKTQKKSKQRGARCLPFLFGVVVVCLNCVIPLVIVLGIVVFRLELIIPFGIIVSLGLIFALGCISLVIVVVL